MMTQAVADNFPEQLTRDLAFILDLDSSPSPPSVVRRPLAMPALGSMTASASIGFSALAVLVVGTAVMLADRRPPGGEREAVPSPPSRGTPARPATVADASASPRPTIPDIVATPAPISAASAPLIVAAAEVDRTAAVGSLDRAIASARSPVRERDPAGTRVAARTAFPDRTEVAVTKAVRPPAPVRERLAAGPRPADAQVVRTPPVTVASAAGALGTPPRPVTAPAVPTAMNPAPIPIAKLRAARRDAQDALIGLRRQL